MKSKQKGKKMTDFEALALQFPHSANKGIIKQSITPYKCRHIHGKYGQIIEKETEENTQMFNSAIVSISDDAGSLHSVDFSETEWNFKPIGDGMSAVQTLHGVNVYDEYVDYPIGNYDNVSPFFNGLAIVEKDGKLGVIGKTGQEIVPIMYKNNSYKTAKGKKVEQFEVLNGVVVAVGENTIDVYSKHGEILYIADKDAYDAEDYSDSVARRFITYLSRIESLRDMYNDLKNKQNKYDETTINRINARIDTSIKKSIISLGSVEKYEQFINELDTIKEREKDPMYRKVKEEKYKQALLNEIESWKNADLC